MKITVVVIHVLRWGKFIQHKPIFGNQSHVWQYWHTFKHIFVRLLFELNVKRLLYFLEGVCKARVRTSLICMHVCVCVVKAPCPNTAPLAKLWPRAARHAAFPLFLVRERSLLFITGWLLSWANRDAQRVQRTSSHLNTDPCLCFCPSFSL